MFVAGFAFSFERLIMAVQEAKVSSKVHYLPTNTYPPWPFVVYPCLRVFIFESLL
jgi:hypothetical protein